MAPMKRNFVVKTIDGKVGGVQKALKGAGIEVVSVIEVFKEELPATAEPDETQAEAGVSPITTEGGES